MSSRSTIVATILVGLFLLGSPVASHANDAREFDADIQQLSHDWERIKFQVDNRDEQEMQMAALAERAADMARKYRQAPDTMIWIGIITSEQASMANENGSPLKALGFAKRARDVLENAEKVDPETMDAGAPTTLGVLYDRVPGFPIAFGDKSKARYYLQEAIAKAPNSLDANYFYGTFLYEQGEYPQAMTIFKHALTLPILTARPIWDRFCRQNIRVLVANMHSAHGL